MILAHDAAPGGFLLALTNKGYGPLRSGETWWVLAEPWGENVGEELQTFELFCTLKDARETQKIFEFGESCRPVPVEIKILG